MYGETLTRCLRESLCSGLSPRVRGNLDGDIAVLAICRSIPACTGKPSSPMARDISVTVYPRVYGETSSPMARDISVTVYPRVYGETSSTYLGALADTGLSPRVRGNPFTGIASATTQRSIPACTGKPSRLLPMQSDMGVYPRVYGETWA